MQEKKRNPLTRFWDWVTEKEPEVKPVIKPINEAQTSIAELAARMQEYGGKPDTSTPEQKIAERNHTIIGRSVTSSADFHPNGQEWVRRKK